MAEKNRNGGKWTEARYRGFITSVLRSGSRRWPPKWEVLREAFKREGINPKTKRTAKLYGCALCDEEFSQKDVQVDHIEPIGDTKTWDEFIERLFCEADNLQVLCKGCHKKKSAAEREGRQPLKSVKVSKQRKGRSNLKGKSTKKN